MQEISDSESFHTHIFNGEIEESEKTVDLVASFGYGFEESRDTEFENMNNIDRIDKTISDNYEADEETPNTLKQLSNFEWDFNHQIDDILSLRRRKSNSLANRRDVVNKSILRGFKKFFFNLLNQESKIPIKLTKKLNSDIKSEIIHRAINLGLLNLKPIESKQEDFESLICWMGFWKNTEKVKHIFDDKFASINIMSNILENYSHHKLSKLYKNKEIMSLFGYFIKYGKDSFMKGNKQYKLSNKTGLLKSYEYVFQTSRFIDLR